MNNLKGSIPHFFRAYDVRGIYGPEITTDVAYRIGRAFCSYLGKGSNINVAEDTRNGSSDLCESLENGILDSGCNVINVGKVPSPILYFSTERLRSNAGVMITASHLPPEWNGFKFCDQFGQVISEGHGLESIGKIYLNEFPEISVIGEQKKYNNIISDYSNFIKRGINKIRPDFKVTVDTSNSVPALFLPQLFNKANINSIFINTEILEHPLHDVEPGFESMRMLSEKVVENDSDLGLIFDSDGDRVAFVDENGKIYPDGVILISLISNIMAKQNRTDTVVVDITCPTALLEYLESIGLKPVISRVGHNYCSSMALSQNSIFAAQFSGHISLRETNYRDDAIYASFKLMEFVSNLGEPLSNYIKNNIPRFFYKTAALEIPEIRKFGLMRDLIKIIKNCEKNVIEIDGVKAVRDEGSYLIRASNTSNIIRIMAEGKNKEVMEKMMNIAMKKAKEVINND